MNQSASRPEPLWWADPPPPLPPLEGELDVEILIVGGGITGLTLAWTMVERGATVGLLDGRRLAASSSGRNAGFLLVTPNEPYQEAVALWGRAGARAVLETGRRSHQRIAHLVQSLDIDCDYRANGSLRLAVTDEEAEDIRDSLAVMHVDGFPMEEYPIAGAVPGYAVDQFKAAFFTREDGELHPVRFLHGLARAAMARGARMFESSPVVSARWQGGQWEVRTPAAVARAGTLVLATNAEAPRLVPVLGRVIGARRGQMLSTAPLDRVVAPLPVYSHWGYRYWRQTPDGRLVIGGWRDVDQDAEMSASEDTTPTIQSAIEGGLRVLVPEGAPIERRWAGTLAYARDGRPLVGWLDADHHLAMCAAFTGHGLGMAASCTLDLAEVLSFRPAPGIATYDPGRFPELRQAQEPLTALGSAAG